ncbi:MAG: hypothetical protein GYA17_07095, partial [Chloroflexi bacterium]|nr:hypothetical protein [Chloroflexota bacterium]
MKNSLYPQRISKTVRPLLAVFLTGTMLLGLCACSGLATATTDAAVAGETEAVPPVGSEQAEQTEAVQPVEVEQTEETEAVQPVEVEQVEEIEAVPPVGVEQVEETAAVQPMVVERAAGPEALQTANEATALALRYYIYARLKTEALIEADFESMPDGAFESQMDELVSIWETADALTTGAEKIIDQAILLLETSSGGETAAFVQPQPHDTAFAAGGSAALAIPLADDAGEVIDRQTWAENLSKQYDALRGAQRYKQLAQQLGTDTKTAVEQMVLAQKIIRNAADLEEAQAVSAEYNRSLNTLQVYKTGSKVGLYLGATIATGGGSLTALAGSSMSLGTAGAVAVGGVDCIVDVGATASTIVLGEDHQVTVDFQNASDVLQPVSMVMGLVTLNPNDAEDMVAMVGESLMEWFVPGKITGVGVEIV